MRRPTFDDYVAARGAALLRFAYLVCGDRHLAEDLVQEVLVKAYRRWSAIENEDPDAYLKQALVRTHISWRRRRSAAEIVTAQFDDSGVHDGTADGHASRDEAWRLLATLPRAQRAVLVLRFFEDLDDQRISEVLGVSASTVRVNAHRGLRTLRETLVQHAEEAPAGAGLAAQARDGVARAARRRRGTVAAGLAGLVVVLVLLLLPLTRPTHVPPVEPTPSSDPSPAPSATSTLMLVPTDVNTPAFPYTLGWAPSSLGEPTAQLIGGRFTLRYGPAGQDLQVSAGTAPYSFDWEAAQTSTTTVNGAAAQLRSSPQGVDGGPYVALSWQRDGLFLMAQTLNGALDTAALRRLAENLIPGALDLPESAAQPDLATVALPEGYVVTGWDRDLGVVCALPQRIKPTEYVAIEGLCISIAPSVVGNPGVFLGKQRVDGWEVVLYTNGLTAELDDGRILTITAVADLGLNSEDFVAIYRGIHLRPGR